MNEAQLELAAINEATPGWLPIPNGEVCFLIQIKGGGWRYTYDPHNLGDRLYYERLQELKARRG